MPILLVNNKDATCIIQFLSRRLEQLVLAALLTWLGWLLAADLMAENILLVKAPGGDTRGFSAKVRTSVINKTKGLRISALLPQTSKDSQAIHFLNGVM